MTRRLAAEDGSVLLEALVGAVLVAVMAVAFFGALDGSNRVSTVSKLRAEAGALAADDQERLRSMPVSTLNNLRQSNPKQMGTTNFTVDSRADWIADSSGSNSCASNGGAADYLKITSMVTPLNNPGLKPVVVTSMVTPPPGSFGGKGSLVATVSDRNAHGLSGVRVNVSGPASATDTTDSNGCVFFGYLPAGTTYSVAATASGYVDMDGNASASAPVTINDQQVATQALTYDIAGASTVGFFSKPIDASGVSRGSVPSNQWMVTMSNGAHVRTFGSNYASTWPYQGGTSSSMSATSLFPFTSPYTVYAGNCTKNDPAQNGVTDPGLTVNPGDASLTYSQQLPALNVLAKLNGTAAANLNVVLTVDPVSTGKSVGCGVFSLGRVSDANGLIDAGVPYGTYDVCVDNGTRRQRLAGTVDAASLPGTALKTVNLQTTGGTLSSLGKCP
jgi:hypothetical protein